MTTSKISYLDHVINPYSWHCNKVSEGCKNCYMMTRARKLQNHNGVGAPLWRDSKVIASEFAKLPPHTVCGIGFMSDTWHESVPLEIIARIHAYIATKPDNVFMYTTKRSQRLAANAHTLAWPDNLWVGVSVELPKYSRERLDHLRQVPTANRWVSFEPLLDQFGTLDLHGIGFVITGGESGFGFRPMIPSWALGIGNQAMANGIPFYHKQGSHEYPDQNWLLNGKEYRQLPKAFTTCRERAHDIPVQQSMF